VSASPTAGAAYRERLHVPGRWWALLVLFVVAVWLSFTVSTPPLVALPATGVVAALGAALLWGYGSARVEVRPDALLAGRARLEWAACGPAEPLDADATRRVLGVEADSRAYLLVRPYVAAAVRVGVDDPRDPTPYWVLSSRSPRRLAESVNAARVVQD
jgi:hypothetical protein